MTEMLYTPGVGYYYADAYDMKGERQKRIAASRAARKRHRKTLAVAARTAPAPSPQPKPQPDRQRQAILATRARSTVALHTKIASLNATLRRQQADFAAHPTNSYLAYCVAQNLRELAATYDEIVLTAAGLTER